MSNRQNSPADIGVCLAHKFFYPVYGGGAMRFQRYAPGLARSGIRMRAFTQAVTSELMARQGSLADEDNRQVTRSDDAPEWPLLEVIDGLPVQRTELPGGWRRWPAYFRSLVRYCEERRQEIDVVQFISLQKWAAPWVPRLRRLGIGTVITCTMVGEFSSNPWKRALQRFDRRFPFQLVDQVVVSSSVMRRYLEELGVSTPIQVIPNGVDLRRFRPVANGGQKSRLRQDLGLDPNWEIVLAVGPVSPRKGTDILIDAFVRLCHERRNVRLVLVGPNGHREGETTDGFHQRLRCAIANGNAEDRVIFVGPVNNVEEYLRAADLLVFPSRREGMGNAVLEAMACGIPVVTTPFTGRPEEFGSPGTHYLLSSWEPEALAANIRKLLGNEGFRRSVGQQGRRWVEENLDVDDSLDRYATLYRDLTSWSSKAKSRPK